MADYYALYTTVHYTLFTAIYMKSQNILTSLYKEECCYEWTW
jgi:hypothetical protein